MADLRQCVCFMLGQNNHFKNSEIGKHFLQDGFKRRTVYDLIKRYPIDLSIEDQPRSDCPTSFNRKILNI